MTGILGIAVSGRKLSRGEGNLGEHFAGILCGTAAVRTFLAGNAVGKNRYYQLSIPLQADDRELPQSYIESSALIAHTEILVEKLPNLLGDKGSGLLAAAAVAAVLDSAGENHGIQNLNGCHRGIVLKARVVTAVYMGLGILTAEYYLFGEYRKAVKGGRSAALDYGIYQNTVVEGDIDAVAAPVKGYILNFHGRMEQLCTANMHRSGIFQNGLASGGQVNSQVFDTILIPAGICDLLYMDRHGFPDILRSAALAVHALVRHVNTSNGKFISYALIGQFMRGRAYGDFVTGWRAAV